MKAMFIKDTDSVYKILEIEKTASDEELKSLQTNGDEVPSDKVHHLGPEYAKRAGKIQKINKAYESVKRGRGYLLVSWWVKGEEFVYFRVSSSDLRTLFFPLLSKAAGEITSSLLLELLSILFQLHFLKIWTLYKAANNKRMVMWGTMKQQMIWSK